MFAQTYTPRDDWPITAWNQPTSVKTSDSTRAILFDQAFGTTLLYSSRDIFSVRPATPVWGGSGSQNTGVGSIQLLESPSQVQISARDLCRERLTRVITLCERLPESYNKFLVQGSGRYSSRILSRIDENRDDSKRLFSDIRKFASELESLCRQYVRDFASTFALLDLAILEDRFELIQAKSARIGLFPRLEDAPVADLLRE
jgi:hypothetical protein